MSRRGHHHRVPVVLTSEQVTAWLDPRTPVGELETMLQPYEAPLAVLPVSTVVNAGKVDDARCLERAAESDGQSDGLGLLDL